jgi:hypothetical protein
MQRPGRFAMAARSLRGYVRHSRKSSYSFVTIRQLLTPCGARMPLTKCLSAVTRSSTPQHAMARSTGASLVSALEDGL